MKTIKKMKVLFCDEAYPVIKVREVEIVKEVKRSDGLCFLL